MGAREAKIKERQLDLLQTYFYSKICRNFTKIVMPFEDISIINKNVQIFNDRQVIILM